MEERENTRGEQETREMTENRRRIERKMLKNWFSPSRFLIIFLVNLNFNIFAYLYVYSFLIKSF